MINLTKGNSESIYFTGTEKATISDPFFLFVFTHRLTEDVVKIMVTNESTNLRYDLATVVVNDYFTGYDDGLWKYQVIEKADDADLTVTGTVVEEGYMELNPATAFEPTEYSEQINTFVTYGE